MIWLIEGMKALTDTPYPIIAKLVSKRGRDPGSMLSKLILNKGLTGFVRYKSRLPFFTLSGIVMTPKKYRIIFSALIKENVPIKISICP
jgi:hypothetical protein